MSGRTVVLTGGTAGIGAALAQQLRKSGDRVVVIGRRASGDAVAVDLRNSDAPAEVQSGLDRLGVSSWNVLIHNAAVGWVGAFPEQTAECIRDLLETNVWAPIALTRRLLPQASPHARIVFVSSPVAHWPSSDYSVYAASKAALEAFARALRAERSFAGSVQVVRPSPTATEMLDSDAAARLGVDSSRFATAKKTATSLMAAIGGKPRWRGTDFASSMAAPLRRWLGGRLSKRRPRIPWPLVLSNIDRESTAPKVLITGAAEGIGRALALRFGVEGWNVVGVDRNEERLLDARRNASDNGDSLTPLTCDLAQRESMAALADELERLAPFDAVIHNAGINRFGRFPESDLDQQRSVFDVNLVAPILLTRELFARRLLAPRCRFGFVSSLSHFVGYPGSAVYAATKTGLASFAESMGAAGRELGFTVTTIFPGPTRTRQAFENSPDNSREHLRTDPHVLAKAIFRAMMARKPVLVYGAGARIAAEVGQRLPSVTESLMRRSLFGKPASRNSHPK